MAMILPPGWNESDYTQTDIGNAFDLLIGTFRKRYHHLNARKLKLKADSMRQGIRGLRVFRRYTGPTLDMCAFFFVRINFRPPAYCLSAGADPSIGLTINIAGRRLYDDLLDVCRSFYNDIPNNFVLDVVHHRDKDIRTDFDETTHAQIVGEAFRLAQNDTAHTRLRPRADAESGAPWPVDLWRWEIIKPVA